MYSNMTEFACAWVYHCRTFEFLSQRWLILRSQSIKWVYGYSVCMSQVAPWVQAGETCLSCLDPNGPLPRRSLGPVEMGPGETGWRSPSDRCLTTWDTPGVSSMSMYQELMSYGWGVGKSCSWFRAHDFYIYFLNGCQRYLLNQNVLITPMNDMILWLITIRKIPIPIHLAECVIVHPVSNFQTSNGAAPLVRSSIQKS